MPVQPSKHRTHVPSLLRENPALHLRQARLSTEHYAHPLSQASEHKLVVELSINPCLQLVQVLRLEGWQVKQFPAQA